MHIKIPNKLETLLVLKELQGQPNRCVALGLGPRESIHTGWVPTMEPFNGSTTVSIWSHSAVIGLPGELCSCPAKKGPAAASPSGLADGGLG